MVIWGMALLPYTLLKPKGRITPLVVDSPHSGRIYPVDFAYVCPLPLLRQIEDAYMDEVIAGATEAGACVVLAEFPRSMIDPNRAENDIDPEVIDDTWTEPLAPEDVTLSGFGLVRRLCQRGVPVYRAPLSAMEIRRRINLYYHPYHACLQQQIEARLKQFGLCALIDAHSMPDRTENGVPRPDFILGDRDGTSCDPTFTLTAQRILESMGYTTALNEPYKGREIVRRYGMQGQGAQALQLEINRKLYLNECAVEKHQGFLRLRHAMTEFFHKLVLEIQSTASDRLAAE